MQLHLKYASTVSYNRPYPKGTFSFGSSGLHQFDEEVNKIPAARPNVYHLKPTHRSLQDRLVHTLANAAQPSVNIRLACLAESF